MKTITILIPAYNEAAVLPQLFARLETLQHSVDHRRYQFEFLFINDGSQDHTLELIPTSISRATLVKKLLCSLASTTPRVMLSW